MLRLLLTWAKTRARMWLLRRKFSLSVIYSGANVDDSSVLGEYSVLFENAALINSSLGAYSYVQSNSVISDAAIGKFCSIASGVNIGLENHPMHMVSSSPVFYDNTQPLPRFLVKKQIVPRLPCRTIIGADVWIGQGAKIMAGVTVGVGAVIGAGAVVTKDVAPYAIVVGSPCKQIRSRFSDEIAHRLVVSRWWELNDERLSAIAHLFVDPQSFLDELERQK